MRSLSQKASGPSGILPLANPEGAVRAPSKKTYHVQVSLRYFFNCTLTSILEPLGNTSTLVPRVPTPLLEEGITELLRLAAKGRGTGNCAIRLAVQGEENRKLCTNTRPASACYIVCSRMWQKPTMLTLRLMEVSVYV